MKTAEAKTAATAAKSNAPFFQKGGANGLVTAEETPQPFFQKKANDQYLQKKLSVGEPDDKYEQEADAVADKVVQRLSVPGNVSEKNPSGDIQPKPLAATITPLVQKCAACDQEQKQEKKEDEPDQQKASLQKKPIFESDEEPPHGEDNKVQRKCEKCEHDEKVQAKPEPYRGIPLVQKKCAACEEEDKKKVQKKESSPSSSASASASVEASLSASKGSGSPLPATARTQMESSFGIDFSGVRIHTGSTAVQMSKSLNAQAFTHGSDIYFNSGKYDPASTQGKHLLAHELTHTVQQGAAIQKKSNPNITGTGTQLVQRAWYNFNIPGTDLQFDPSLEGISNAAGMAYDLGADAIRASIDYIAPGLLDFLENAANFVKQKILSGIDSATGGLFSRIQSSGLATILTDVFGAAFSSIGTGITEGCTAIANAAKKLYAFAKKLVGPAIQAFKTLMGDIGDFLSGVWDDFGQPAWDAIKLYAGEAWSWIEEKATWLWDLTLPVRETLGRAWDWIKRQFGIAWGETKSVLSWIKEKASDAWDWIKEKIQPIIEPLKMVAKVLVMLSPAGPVIAIWYGAPKLWEAIKWLADKFNKYVIIRAKDYFYKKILPLIKSGLDFAQGMVNTAMGWLSNGFTMLGTAISSAINALASLAPFQVIQSGIRRIANGFRAGITFITTKAVAFGRWVSTTAARIWNYLEPLRQLLRNLLLIGMLGPYAILDDGVWNMIKSIVALSLKVPCIRELEGLLQIPFWVEQISRVRQMLKDAWFMINHPEVLEAKARAFLEPYIQQIPGKAESALTRALATVGLATSRHISGIMRYLLPGLTHMLANWWPEVKKMIWYLIWPFGEGSPLYTDAPKLWNLVPQIWSSIWSGNFTMARDGFLEWMQALNNVLGIFAGWIAIGGALIGAIVGAFAGGVGAIPGAGAGFEIGIEIGEGIMISMLATETTIIEAAVYDLLTVTDDGVSSPPPPPDPNAPPDAAPAAGGAPGGSEAAPRTYTSGEVHTGHDRIEYAYQRIGNSSLTLGIMGALMLLGAIGGEIAEALMGLVKRAGNFVAERLPALAELATDAGRALRESRAGRVFEEARSEFQRGRAMVNGEIPTPERPVIDEEGRAIADAEMSADGKRRIETTAEGECLICSSPCRKLIEKYEGRINKIEGEGSGVRDRIRAIERSGLSAEAKTRMYAEIDSILDGSIKADSFSPLSPEHKMQRWLDYQLRNPEEFPQITRNIDPAWEKRYETIINNNAEGSQFEQDALNSVNRPRNNHVMTSPDGATFKPDSVADLSGRPVTELTWGEKYNFTEVKGWQYMSDTGNLSLMLDYVENVGGHLDIIFTSDHPLTSLPTELSEPLRLRINRLRQSGKVAVRYYP